MSKVLFSEIFVNTRRMLVQDCYGVVKTNIRNIVLLSNDGKTYRREFVHIVELINEEYK